MELQIFAWVMDIFFIITLHILYKQILGSKTENKLWLILGWSGYFCVWNLCSYLSSEFPLVNGIYTIVINFLIMYLLYKGSLRAKVILVFIVILLGAVSEIIAGFLLGLFAGTAGIADQDYLYLGSASSKIFWFLFVKVIARISKRDKQVKIGFMEWMEIFAVPLGSLIIFYLVARNEQFNITVGKLMIFTVLLVINLLTYYIYQKLQLQAEELMNSQLLKQQNEYYKLRFEETEKQWTVLKKIRHDMKNNYVLELSYLENQNYEELHKIYTGILGDLNKRSTVIDTGNIGIDSILNYKVEMARENKIEVEYVIQVGSSVAIDNGHLTILFGNLFDNAMEAVRKMPEGERRIRFKLSTDQTALFFVIENPYDGMLKKNKKNEIVTSKSNEKEHGIGLKTVKEIVDMYHGSVTIDAAETTFKVTVFMYMGHF